MPPKAPAVKPKIAKNQNKEPDLKKPPVIYTNSQKEIKKLSEILDCPVLSYYKPSGTSIWSKDLYAIWECLKHIGKVDKLALYVRSDGGSGMISLRIINLLRSYAKKLIILAPSECASAATMLALGCDEIHLGPLSSLSAVDSSLIHPLSPVDPHENPVSVSQDELWRVLRLWKEFYTDDQPFEYVHSAEDENELSNPDLKLGFTKNKNQVSDKHKLDINIPEDPKSEKPIENPYKYLYQYVHPLVFGAIDRSRSLSVQLCKEILEYHIKDPQKIDSISHQLNYGYPAHGYPITQKEAIRIGLNIKPINEEAQNIIGNLQLLYGEMTDEMITDYDNFSYHNHSVYTIAETNEVQIFFQNDFDKHYRENEKRYITINDHSGWFKTTATKPAKKGDLEYKVERVFL